uniref:Uncharacterized protein n=1 Tax=Sphaeramia orbicularis TaxID=375764 RepID=A0A672ZT39_9TELE
MFVGLDLQLQFVHQVLQSRHVLAVFLGLVGELFDAALILFLELLLATLHGNLLCLIQTVLQIFDGLFHVLLHALQMGTGTVIQLQLIVTLHLLLDSQCFIAHPLVVSLGLIHFFIFLSQFTFHISLHLVELQLSPEDLALLMFQGTLCLLQG